MMHRVRKSVIKKMIIFFVFFVIGFEHYSLYALTGVATGWYRTDMVAGIASDGPGLFSTYRGYTSNTVAGGTVANWKYEMEHSKFVFMQAHGAPGRILIYNDLVLTALYISTMSFSSTPRLVYISACKSGANSTTYGNIGSTLVNKGVGTVVAFTDNVSYYSFDPSGGINLFNSTTAYYLSRYNYSVTAALNKGATVLFNQEGAYYGADSRVVYGNTGKIWSC